MKTSPLASLALAVVASLAAAPAFAGSIPYQNVGTVAPQVATYAATSNGVSLYYFGSTAGYTDSIEVYDVQTHYDSGAILNNKSTSVGAEVTIGTGAGQINAGDQLIFYIDSPDGKFASISSYSADSINHAYITSYAGGRANNVNIPAGLFVGMEDLNSGGDLNYNDDTFIFTGVSAPSIGVGATVTPEPGSLVLLGTGLVSAFGLSRRRSAL